MPRKTTPPAPSHQHHHRARGLVGVLVYVLPEVRAALRAAAEQRGLSLQQFSQQVLAEAASGSGPNRTVAVT